DIERHLAHALHLDALLGQRDEGRRPLERDLADAITIGARDGFHDTGLRVDDDRRLFALTGHHAGLDRRRRCANRAFATRDVVPAGVDEEEPKVSAWCDRLGHHGDQKSAMPAGLEAKSGAHIVEPLLKPSALFADRAPW